jgi:outer membrane protein assembly factor BamB
MDSSTSIVQKILAASAIFRASRQQRMLGAILTVFVGAWLYSAKTPPTQAQTGLLAAAGPSDWPVLVGGNPARNGRSAAFGPTAPTLLWQGGSPTIYVHQPVIEGNIVVNDRTANPGDYANGSLVEARNLTTGALLWTASLPSDFPDQNEHIQVMGMNNGQVYATRAANGHNNYIYALDALSGAVRWRSESLVEVAYGLNFASNGDLIIGKLNALLRINATTGVQIWSVGRICPIDDTCGAAIFGDHGYIWQATLTGPQISVIDIKLGQKLYLGAPTNGKLQETLPFVGPDGTVYAPRNQNNTSVDYLIAYTDTGTALVEKWRRSLGYTPFGSFGVGPDGSVYSYSAQKEVLRLDPATGAILNRSIPLLTSFPLIPRMVIDAAGILYVSNGGFNDGVLYSFNPDLTLRWSDNIHYLSLGGVALGQNGILVTSGDGTNLRAYFTDNPPPTKNTVALPLLANIGAPDLVGSIALTPPATSWVAGDPVQITVTITNVGQTSAAPFWTDLYINPSAPPQVNRPWYDTCTLDPCFGLAWGVATQLAPGESITLTSDVGSYAEGYSVWPGWFASGTTDLYLLVDSWNPASLDGAVSESNETNNLSAIHGLVVTGTNPPFRATAPLSERARPALVPAGR